MAKKGSLSITSENIFPVIKKWLYSDHDIFYRELISNGCDAITKLKKLELMGEYEKPEEVEYKIQVSVNPTDKTITIEDNGLGMTEEEIDKYINQIAFSGVQDFMEKYKDKANEDQIIGHFGLGFYSAFMVADKVEINSLSYQKDAKPVHWESEGGINFEMTEGDKAEVGTSIKLYLNEESTEFANEYRAREVIEKYCAFMPVNIFLKNETAEPEYETIEKDELTDKDTVVETVIEPAKTEEKEKEDGTKETVEVEPSREKYKILKRPVALNDTNPLWNKHPNECTDEQYKDFYRKVFRDYKEPLFWIHLNMDYPFNLKGILYFPKINMEYDSLEGTIKLYNNQVFIADNIKEVIPEFLMLLKGVIDCPDLPLNVSRSALQNDGFVKKISDYITKKVADKLSGMCKTDRENYEKYWDDIAPFIKYGYIKDEKFAEKMGDYILYKNLEGKYLTLNDCLEENKEKHENTIFYVTNEKEQSQYINMFKEEGIDAVIMPAAIDNPFISHVEQKHEGLKFLRIDTDLNASFKEEVKEDDEAFKKTSEELTEVFKKALNNDKLDIKVEKMKNASVASMITVSEETRRMQDMMKMYSMGGMDMSAFGATGETLVLNANHPLVKYVLEHKDGENTAKICEQLYDLASLAHGQLSPERMTGFVNRSNDIMMIMAGQKAE
ncbi:molecular chaperone HtpG [Clostridium sp. AM22-11AC]|uniref:molecular chaperone HtpG n=1 Tax=Clostridium sp. AM22-11AC TaxID=2293024 RepID=UPI000E48B2F5|nr:MULTISPECIES: molecular chaperone HtpG [unclassified Clostridium]MEE0209647.1 molecular chaperone HtpG [Enterocloster sp.]RHO02363.1 molecular chaperone HtpG [Clostridium sp. AM22-11AC]RHQ07940.1 molecular chaperone HtpG [Clostridium sp. AM51-4]RHU39599.1 molecular chaperone HtpG [Clostridium sp. TM06-18]RHV50911.1 molecular chaperone HtpG [Clostridium sp. OM04-12AA]